MPFPLPIGHKFACIALDNAGVDRGLRDPIDCGDGIWAIFEPPFALDDAWRQWLGSIQAEHLTRSSLVCFAHQASANPAVLDNENKQLEQRALSLFYALFLVDVFHHDGGLILSGANVDGRAGVRSVSQLEPHYRPNGVSTVRIDRAFLLKAACVAMGIRAVHGGGQHERLRRGFHAWVRAVQELYGDERLHQFVRATEALVKPQIGRSRRQFVHRSQLFSGNTRNSVALLEELYELRNNAEHLHRLDHVLASNRENERERIALRRAYQAQLLASHVYERIFSDQQLQRLFATDAGIDAFWATPWPQQVQTWGVPIDLDALATARFLGPF